jgi:translocation protein SEC62
VLYIHHQSSIIIRPVKHYHSPSLSHPSSLAKMSAQGPPQGPPMPGPPLQPGQQPTPEQIAIMQRQLAVEAEKHGMTVPQYIEQLKAQAMQNHQAQLRAQQQQQMAQQQQQQQQQPIQPGPPNPAAIAVANFLKSQEMKPRTVILDEKRKEMFKGLCPQFA